MVVQIPDLVHFQSAYRLGMGTNGLNLWIGVATRVQSGDLGEREPGSTFSKFTNFYVYFCQFLAILVQMCPFFANLQRLLPILG